MTRPSLSRRRVLVAASCVAPLAGCSVLPDPPAAQIYRLSPLADDPPNGRIAAQAAGRSTCPTASESLDTDRIALTRGRTRFDYYADSIWTDRVPVLLQGLLVEAFENDGHIAEVGRDAQRIDPRLPAGDGDPGLRSTLCRLRTSSRLLSSWRLVLSLVQDAGSPDDRSHADNGTRRPRRATTSTASWRRSMSPSAKP